MHLNDTVKLKDVKMIMNYERGKMWMWLEPLSIY